MAKRRIGLIVCCSLLVAGVGVAGLSLAAWALFSDTEQASTHLEAGTLDAELWEMSESGVRLGADGSFEEYSEKTETNLSDVSLDDDTLFDLKGFIPGMYIQSDLEVRNVGDAPFTYSVSILDVTAETQADKALAEQTKVTVTSGDTETSFFLDEVLSSEGQTKTIEIPGEVVASEKSDFSIKAEFVNDAANNDAKNGQLSFDIQVVAEQVAPSEGE